MIKKKEIFRDIGIKSTASPTTRNGLRKELIKMKIYKQIKRIPHTNIRKGTL
jgi:hypothetical protein